MTRRVAYIIPGFTEKTADKPYRLIGRYFKQAGIMPIYADVDWNKKAEFTAMPIYANKFADFVKKSHTKEGQIYVLGFSFGAMIAYITCQQIKAHTLILCSLSPYFKEDFSTWPKSWKRHPKKIQPVAKKIYSANFVAKSVQARAFSIVGSKEPKQVLARSAEVIYRVGNGELIISKNARHNIRQKEYLSTLKLVISKL